MTIFTIIFWDRYGGIHRIGCKGIRAAINIVRNCDGRYRVAVH